MKNLSAKELREIEALYRSGTQSMASIAKRFGITRQSLAERVKRHGWRAGAATRPDQPGKPASLAADYRGRQEASRARRHQRHQPAPDPRQARAAHEYQPGLLR